MQVVFSGFSVRLFCFVQANTVCRYGCMYAMNFMIVPGMFVCSRFLISVCMFIVSIDLLILRGSHLAEPLCYGVVYCV